MIMQNWMGYSVVFDDTPFDGFSPFNLRSDLKNLKIGETEKLEIQIKLQEELAKGGPRNDAFRCICGSIISIFVADIRCSDKNSGKSTGYRVFLLVVPYMECGYVLGIKKHKHTSKDTVLTKQEKEQLKKIVKSLEEDVKGKQ